MQTNEMGCNNKIPSRAASSWRWEWVNFISEIIRPGAYDVDQLFWFKVDNFHHRSITVYSNGEIFAIMKQDLSIYREEMRNAGVELVEMEEGPFLGGV